MSEGRAEPSGHPSAFARAVGSGAAGLLIGTVICVLMYSLRYSDCRPLNELAAFEERAYQAFRPPPLDPVGGFQPVVFVDIDNYAVETWNPASFKPCNSAAATSAAAPGGRISVSAGTPRSMLAAVVHAMRAAQARVVFLDYDLRNMLPDDDVLRQELHCPDATARGAKDDRAAVPTTVLLPRYFTARTLPPCGEAKGREDMHELDTVFESAMTPDRVEPVHPVVAGGSYGLIEGVCRSYVLPGGRFRADITRQAAMFRAVSLANKAAPGLADSATKMQPLRWWIDGNTQNLLTAKQQTAYTRINASVLLQDGPVETDNDGSVHTKTMRLNAVKGAIVIVGSTHPGAGDFYATPLGNMPGALVHANLALALQVPSLNPIPLLVQAVVDVVISVLFAFCTTWCCWYRLYQKIDPGTQITRRQKLERYLSEFGMLLGMGVTLFMLMVAGSGYEPFAGWHFAILSFILGAVIVLLIEVIAMAAEALEEWVPQWISRRPGSGPAGRRVPKEPIAITRVEKIITDERFET